MKKFLAYIKKLPESASKPWYPYAMALIAFADYFLFVIPLDAMVVASVIASKRHWKAISFWTCLGSTLGALLFAILIQQFGDVFLHNWAPHLLEDPIALTITHWLQHYGFWALLLIAMGPIHQHPTVAIAALAKVPLSIIFITMFLGRLFKYVIYTWLSTHAKRGLSRFFKE